MEDIVIIRGNTYIPTIALIIVLIVEVTISQSISSSRICGNIIDAETREPIAYANIFITNSSIGTASDENGYFELRNIPHGRYEIIALVLGYEVLKATVGIYNNSRRNFRFEMYKEPIQFPEIIVTASDRKRNKHLKKFRINLLGKSQNGKKTYIKNEDAIYFKVDETGTLRAYTHEPLQIVNNSLGFNITYVLEDFELTPEYVRYTGYPYFTEKTATTYHDSVDWPENRRDTYTGSLRHFLTTICENYKHTDGDTLARSIIKDYGDIRIDGIRQTYGDTTHIENEGFVVIQTNYAHGWARYAERRLINTNSILMESDNPNEMKLQFGGYLEVKYENEYFPFENAIGRSKKVSWINMTCDSTVLDKQGRYFDIYAIKTTGLWSKERVADMLPFDYKLKKD